MSHIEYKKNDSLKFYHLKGEKDRNPHFLEMVSTNWSYEYTWGEIASLKWCIQNIKWEENEYDGKKYRKIKIIMKSVEDDTLFQIEMAPNSIGRYVMNCFAGIANAWKEFRKVRISVYAKTTEYEGKEYTSNKAFIQLKDENWEYQKTPRKYDADAQKSMKKEFVIDGKKMFDYADHYTAIQADIELINALIKTQLPQENVEDDAPHEFQEIPDDMFTPDDIK